MRSSKSELMRSFLAGCPNAMPTELAARFDCSIALASQIRSKMGLGKPQKRLSVTKVSPQNYRFVIAEAEAANVSVNEMLDAIITDARLDAGFEPKEKTNG